MMAYNTHDDSRCDKHDNNDNPRYNHPEIVLTNNTL